MKQLLTFILLLTILAGCERYDDVEMEIPYKPKIVTSAFLQSSSNTIQIAVTRSQPVFNTEPKPGFEPTPEYITDATVIVKKGNTEYKLTYDPNQNLYQYDLATPMLGGEQYDIIVTSGNETSTGQTTIPKLLHANTSVVFDSIPVTGGGYNYTATITCTPLDPGTYYVDFFPILVYADSSMDLMYNDAFSSIKEVQQGQSFTKTYYSNFSVPGWSPEKLQLMVVNCDEGYARNTNRIYDLMTGLTLTPFSDAATTYTNMKGGIGIIGSFNAETMFTFELK